MSSRYYDRAGNPVEQDEGMALFADHDGRRVARTIVGDVEVSTVHLVINHRWDDRPPLIFETMIFGGEHDCWQWRYTTEAEALTGHERVVAALREGRNP